MRKKLDSFFNTYFWKGSEECERLRPISPAMRQANSFLLVFHGCSSWVDKSVGHTLLKCFQQGVGCT